MPHELEQVGTRWNGRPSCVGTIHARAGWRKVLFFTTNEPDDPRARVRGTGWLLRNYPQLTIRARGFAEFADAPCVCASWGLVKGSQMQNGRSRPTSGKPAHDLGTSEGLVAFLEETVRDLEDALSGRLFYEYDSSTGSLRLRRRRAGWQARKGSSRRPLCGAKTRKGTPCAALAVEGRARCRFHGGCSTGPTSAEGRARIAESNRRRAEARRAAQ